MEKFLDNVSPGCYGSKSARFSQSLCSLFVLRGKVFDWIFHRCKQCCLCETCRGFGLAGIQVYLCDTKFLFLFKDRKFLIFEFFFFCVVLFLESTLVDFFPAGT